LRGCFILLNQNQTAMKLTTSEKLRIFFALLEKYPEHERSRKQAEHLFGSQPKKLKEYMKSINDSERSAYELIKRFADEVGWEIPKYSEPMPTAKSCEFNTEKIIQVVSASQTDEDIKNTLEGE